jgi:hypothetical protein
MTIGVIGQAIKNGSTYLPIRNRAAALASTAPPKNYLLQMKAVFDDFVKRWKYVRDPDGKELVTTDPEQVFHLVMGGQSNDPGAGFGFGVGDCDDATVAIGAQLKSIGFPVRIATLAPQNAPPGRLMSHVFVQAQLPNNRKWVTVDPVVYPHMGAFDIAPHSRLAVFNLEGVYMGGTGNIQNMSGIADGQKKEKVMSLHVNDFQDLAGYDDFMGASDYNDPLDFRQYGVKDFGIYSDTMGMLDLGDSQYGLAAEVDVDEFGRAWTPILEVRPHDYNYLKENPGCPYQGMLALGDDLEVYSYDTNLGFFKKLFKRVKKRVKKSVRKLAAKARSVAKKLLKKLPGGKYLLKLGAKLWKVSKKLLKPLTKFVGKYAKKLAPIAALIPGYGPAIAAALHTSGKIANLMNKVGAKITTKKGEPVAKVKFPSKKAAKVFEKMLKAQAKKEKKRGKKLKKRVRKARRPGPGRRPGSPRVRRAAPPRRVGARRPRMARR